MTEHKIVETLKRVDQALLAEIEVVRDGRFEELRDVQSRTAEAMKALAAIEPEIALPGLDRVRIEAAVASVNHRAQQAKGLLAAALHGARDARTRLEGLIRAEGEVGAYDSQGGRLMMPNHGSPYNKTL